MKLDNLLKLNDKEKKSSGTYFEFKDKVITKKLGLDRPAAGIYSGPPEAGMWFNVRALRELKGYLG
jgi:hypothetical protein